MNKRFIISASVASIIMSGCSSAVHREVHRSVEDATREVAFYQLADQVAGGVGGAVSFGALGFLNHVFRPSPDAGSTCVNGLGQKIDCETKEPIKD